MSDVEEGKRKKLTRYSILYASHVSKIYAITLLMKANLSREWARKWKWREVNLKYFDDRCLPTYNIRIHIKV